MSRYTGPRVKKMRALGVNLPGLSRKTVDRRPYPPGDHGSARRRRSDYAVRLEEKQKLRLNYGVTERQLRRVVVEAQRSPEPTGDKMLELLERRLDNAVFRAGFAPTIPAARQLVSHGHVLLNGLRADIPSIRLKVGDQVQLRPKSAKLATVTEAIEQTHDRPEWLRFEEGVITMLALPPATTVPFSLDIQLVVEFYAKRT
ncbi:MAG: 30S ribosomal protein S4 [Rickettsiales bacterium]|nr:30S ribosomal protein S4 [Rickettsiales bacterium]|tara:strand:- start:1868 stop:2470 length:603 start_codon:yes stop_codon:yes gene_type:complete